jgi:prepilin-type N-terminal cleavage/methylation domain-containing protein
MTRRAFTLVEVLLAVFILGIGIISVSALFPAGIVQQRASNDDALGPVVAQHAMGVIRSKVSQDDFGTFEEYGLYDLGGTAPTTIPGDWLWKRPTMYFQEQLDGVGWTDDPFENDAGAIDIFGTLALNKIVISQGLTGFSNNLNVLRFGSEFGRTGLPEDGGESYKIFGIPPNRLKWDPDRNTATPLSLFFDINEDDQPDAGETLVRQPLAIITQQERWWPASPPVRTAEEASGAVLRRPQFAWDCMFRRFEGRILVAVFVYRVSQAGVEPSPYRAAQLQPFLTNPAAQYPTIPALGSFLVFDQPLGTRPPLASIALNRPNAPRASGGDASLDTRADNAVVFGTQATNPFDVTLRQNAWQAPGQLWLDPWNQVHRVVAGRRNGGDGPVVLDRPVTSFPNVPPFNLNESVYPAPGTVQYPTTSYLPLIWYLPVEDPNGVAITPVFVTVMEL